ncbi:MAG: sensor histidine kinase [Deferribacterales bacterium]
MNLRTKIIIAFIGFSIFLSSLTVGGVILATQYSEERSQRNRIKIEAEYYLADYLSSFTAPASNSFNSVRSSSPFTTYYYGDELLPKWVKERFCELRPGTYFADNDKQQYCILIKPLPDGENFYLLYNVTRLNDHDESLKSLQATILLTLLPILILGVSLGLITANKVIGPVLRLEKIMRNTKPKQKLPDDFDSNFHQDEVGFLAATLKTSVNNMQDSIERETSFARDASHELRTPVTTIKNALELLDAMKPDLDEKTSRVLGRITRATANMEHLIKSFLWLSRQNNLSQFKKESINMGDLVKEVIQEQSYLVEKKKILVNVFDEGVMIEAEPQLIKILIANIIRNAFTYTDEGYVNIYVNKTCFQVNDSGRGIRPEVLMKLKEGKVKSSKEGFGLGISIVKRLCISLGWILYIHSEVNTGTKARICFNGEDSCDGCATLAMEQMN